ncbi:hypothetical protein DAI22_04g053400 [Oryza sativa Japonica Group]|nr:hypothetical protein DAI22_04g053400 [Oryza sativa Japonica Group]
MPSTEQIALSYLHERANSAPPLPVAPPSPLPIARIRPPSFPIAPPSPPPAREQPSPPPAAPPRSQLHVPSSSLNRATAVPALTPYPAFVSRLRRRGPNSWMQCLTADDVIRKITEFFQSTGTRRFVTQRQ